MDKIKDALIEAQAWVMEACACIIDGWKLTTEWLALHRNWTLVIIVALALLAVL